MIYSTHANQDSYPFALPKLPFDKNSFIPYFSAETFDFHYDKHHQTYVTNLNNLLQNATQLSKYNLESLIINTYNKDSAIFNNAAQVWNHTFFWHSIMPKGGGLPSGQILTQITDDFGSFEEFVSAFKQAAISQFGSGWTWLVWNNSKLEIMKTANADTPIVQGVKPLLTCDVWEHAYYIDYRNKRYDYVSAYIEHMINWDFVMINFIT